MLLWSMLIPYHASTAPQLPTISMQCIDPAAPSTSMLLWPGCSFRGL